MEMFPIKVSIWVANLFVIAICSFMGGTVAWEIGLILSRGKRRRTPLNSKPTEEEEEL